VENPSALFSCRAGGAPAPQDCAYVSNPNDDRTLAALTTVPIAVQYSAPAQLPR